MADTMTISGEDARIRAAVRGDHAAFTALVGAHDRDLRGLVYRLLGDAHDMQDTMQEVYVKAYGSIASFRGDASLRTWLFRIAHNACTDHLRRRAARPATETLADAHHAPARAADPVTRLTLAAALDELSVDHRAVVLVVDAAGFSYAEAGAILGASPGTIASRLSHARRRLQHILGETEAHTP